MGNFGSWIKGVLNIKGAEQEVHSNASAFVNFFERSPMPQVIMSKGGVFVDANHSYCKLHGFEKNELTGKTPAQVGLSTHQDLQNTLDAFSDGGDALDGYMTKYRKRNGDFIYAKIYANPIGGDDHFLVIVNDVTQHQVTVKALKESERFLHTVLNTIPSRVFWKDRNLKFLGANQQAAEDIGCSSPSDIIGKTDHDLFDKSTAEAYSADDRYVMQHDLKRLFYEDQQRMEDGTLRWVLKSKVPMKDLSGKVIGILGSYDDITARKQAEMELKLAKFSIDNTISPVVWVSEKGKIIDFNPAFSNMLHYTREELMELGIPDIDPLFTTEKWEPHWADLKKNEVLVFYTQQRCKDGKILDVEVRAHYLKFEDKEYNCAQVNDVTERKLTEVKIKQTNQFLETLLNHIPSGVFWKDRESKYLGVNAMFRKIANYHDEVIGKSDYEFPWAEQADDLCADDRYVMDNNLSKLFYTEPLRNADGKIHYNEVSKVPLINPEGEVFGVMGVFRDITEQIEIEHALKANEKLLNGVIKNAAAIIYIIDKNGIFRLSEGLGLASLGLVPGQIIGHSVFEMYKDQPDITNAIRAAFQGQSVESEVQVDGLTFSTRYTPIKNEKGEIETMLGVSFDITDRKKLEEELHVLNTQLEVRVGKRTEQLQQANQDLEAFAYSVSHDLRAPIRHIDGFSKLMYKAIPNPSETITRHFNRVATSSKRMAQMVDDLLLFARLGKKPISKKEVDLDALIKKTIQHLKFEIGDRAIEWKIDSLGSLLGDGNLIQLAFENLLLNAIKYTSPRPVATITIGAKRTDREIEICFKDNGVGFDMAYADKLFGVFQRLHSQEEFEGTGIGLANVRQIIAKHNGSIEAEGKVDEGATFYITFPLT